MDWKTLLIWAATYLCFAAVFFGVLSSTIDKKQSMQDVKLSTLIVSSLIWPLTLIAAISYKIASWFPK